MKMSKVTFFVLFVCNSEYSMGRRLDTKLNFGLLEFWENETLLASIGSIRWLGRSIACMGKEITSSNDLSCNCLYWLATQSFPSGLGME